MGFIHGNKVFRFLEYKILKIKPYKLRFNINSSVLSRGLGLYASLAVRTQIRIESIDDETSTVFLE